MRLDSLLLSNRALALLVVNYLTAGECMRLGMTCVQLMELVKSRGLLFGPLHQSVPFITGLAPGRSSSYYLDILCNFFGPPVEHRLRTLVGIGECWYRIPRQALPLFVSIYWLAFRTRADRNQILSNVDDMMQKLVDDRTNFKRTERVNFLDSLSRLASHAFCVQNRFLVPGPVDYEQRRFGLFRLHGESESDGSDSEELEVE